MNLRWVRCWLSGLSMIALAPGLAAEVLWTFETGG